MYDAERGINDGSTTEPYILANDSGSEWTTQNWINADNSGFQLQAESSEDQNVINIDGASYIYLAIA